MTEDQIILILIAFFNAITMALKARSQFQVPPQQRAEANKAILSSSGSFTKK